MRRAWRIVVFVGLFTVGIGQRLQGDEASTTPPPPFRYDPGNHRDPFMPLVRDGKFIGAMAGLRGQHTLPALQGIMWDPSGRSLALINDGEVKVGDTVEGYQVVEIRPDGVVVSDGGEPVVLRLNFDAPSPPSSATPKGGTGR